MTSPQVLPAGPAADPSLVRWTHVIYGLHAVAVIAGVASAAATVAGGFVFGLPSLAAVVLNYLKRGEAAGSWLESHFRWQIRTFWFAVLWVAVAVLMGLTIVGLPFALAVLLLAGVWILYRVVRGWWVLIQRRTLPMPPPRI